MSEKARVYAQKPRLKIPFKNSISVGVGSSDCLYWAGIFKPLWSPGIDAKASIPPAYVAWRAGTITLFLLGA